MAIIYSYPKQASLQSTDLLIGTRFSTEPGVTPRSISFSIETLAEYIATNYTSTLDQVLAAGNTSLLDAKVGSIYIHDVSTAASFLRITGNKGRISFYSKDDDLIGYLAQDSLVLNDFSSDKAFTIKKPSNATSNSTAVFQDTSGTVAYLSDIANSPQGLFAQYEDSVYITDSFFEQSLIGGGMGSLRILADTFTKGYSFQANLMGKISCENSEGLRIKVKTATGVILLDTGIMTLKASTDKSWKLDLNFTVRSNGGAGSASIASGGLFSYIKNAAPGFEGIWFDFINDTTFDTTIENEIEITAQWGSINASNKIFSQTFTLNRIF